MILGLVVYFAIVFCLYGFLLLTVSLVRYELQILMYYAFFRIHKIACYILVCDYIFMYILQNLYL